LDECSHPLLLRKPSRPPPVVEGEGEEEGEEREEKERTSVCI
jgi:hypothetical protein